LVELLILLVDGRCRGVDVEELLGNDLGELLPRSGKKFFAPGRGFGNILALERLNTCSTGRVLSGLTLSHHVVLSVLDSSSYV
jgi:hypothetical protein